VGPDERALLANSERFSARPGKATESRGPHGFPKPVLVLRRISSAPRHEEVGRNSPMRPNSVRSWRTFSARQAGQVLEEPRAKNYQGHVNYDGRDMTLGFSRQLVVLARISTPAGASTTLFYCPPTGTSPSSSRACDQIETQQRDALDLPEQIAGPTKCHEF